jgi:hypothetical protein
VRTAFTLIVLLGLLALTVGVAFWAWQEIGDVPISRHGLIALGLGALLTALLGAGLMALMFFSSRRGYDDRASDGDPAARAARGPLERDRADRDGGGAP